MGPYLSSYSWYPGSVRTPGLPAGVPQDTENHGGGFVENAASPTVPVGVTEAGVGELCAWEGDGKQQKLIASIPVNAQE